MLHWLENTGREMVAPILIVPVPCLRDNYAYLVYSKEADGQCVVVDPGESEPVLSEVRKRGLTLKAVLNTHHHWDHVGGNQELVSRHKVAVIGSASDRHRTPEMSRGVVHGERFSIAQMEFRVLQVPGHTSGAITFVSQGCAFTGDTLFCGGCGRLFEGSAQQMHDSLNRVLGELPDETQIYCGHEYTEANLSFACTVFDDPSLTRRFAEVSRRRSRGEFCASSTMGTERETNLFLRCGEAKLQCALNCVDELAAFAELRRRKDNV